MPQYHPPIRDMQFLLHEVLDAVSTLNGCPLIPTSMPTR